MHSGRSPTQTRQPTALWFTRVLSPGQRCGHAGRIAQHLPQLPQPGARGPTARRPPLTALAAHGQPHGPAPTPDRHSQARTAYMARMLFSGSSGISRTLVLERMAS